MRSPDRHWSKTLQLSLQMVLASLVVLIVVLTICDQVTNHHNGDVSSLVSLVQALIWPSVILFIVTLFKDPIFAFLGRLSKVTIKAGESTTTLEVEQARAAVSALLGAATTTAPKAAAELNSQTLIASARIATRSVNEDTLPRFAASSVLWVDDRPENNRYLIKAFEELGIEVSIARSTEEALCLLKTHRYNVIITDMGRPPDMQAGYTLLAQLRERRIHAPVIIYAGSDSEEHRRMARDAGAIESTARPQRVFDLVSEIILSAHRSG